MTSEIVNNFHNNQLSTFSPEISPSSFYLIRNKINNENIQYEFATDTSPQRKIQNEIKRV